MFLSTKDVICYSGAGISKFVDEMSWFINSDSLPRELQQLDTKFF